MAGLQLNVDQRPLYIRAAEKIKEMIRATQLGPDSRLPSEVSLAQSLGVSRSTVREGLRELELRGRIRRVRGRGTIVAGPPPVEAGLTTLESLESLAAQQGWKCETVDVVIEQVPMPAALADRLEVPPGSPTTYLSRVKLRDSQRISRMETWIPAGLVSPEELRARFTHSITEVLLASKDPHLDYAVAEVGAAAADEAAAAALRIKPGTPLVVLTELFYQHPARPICFSANAFLPASVRLEVIRRPTGG